jgi:hypothetical protein
MDAEVRALVDRRWAEYGLGSDAAENGRPQGRMRRKLRL